VNTETKIFELETQLLDSRKRHSKEFLDEILCDDFIEIGSSGRTYGKSDTM
jgi:hypothetical protein